MCGSFCTLSKAIEEMKNLNTLIIDKKIKAVILGQKVHKIKAIFV